MKMRYFILKAEIWIKDLFKNKFLWLLFPVGIAIWLSTLLLITYLSNIESEYIIISINTYGEMYTEIVILIVALLISIVSLIKIIWQKYLYERITRRIYDIK